MLRVNNFSQMQRYGLIGNVQCSVENLSSFFACAGDPENSELDSSSGLCRTARIANPQGRASRKNLSFICFFSVKFAGQINPE
jgi:hypothetical protein